MQHPPSSERGVTAQAERRCPVCGSAVSVEAKFCVVCGASQPEPTEQVVAWRAREGIVVFLLHLLVTGLLAYPLALLITGEDALSVVTILIIELALFGATALWVRIRYGAGLADLGLPGIDARDIGYGAAGFGVGLAGALVISTVASTVLEQIRGVPVEAPQQIRLQDPPEGVLLVLLAIGVVVLAPIAEELFFRGLVFRGLRRWAKPWTAIVLSAVIFGVVHLDPSGAQPLMESLVVIVPAIIGLGVVLAWLVERTGRIVAAIVTHVAFNAFNFALLLASDRLS